VQLSSPIPTYPNLCPSHEKIQSSFHKWKSNALNFMIQALECPVMAEQKNKCGYFTLQVDREEL
jgi:hypothetical protein